jgi:hypothetical protein
MNHFEKSQEIEQVEHKLVSVKSLLEGMLPIFHQVDRKVKSLQTQIHHLEQEKIKLSQGQLRFDLDF